MNTEILRLQTEKISGDDIRHIVRVLERGGLMVFPTDTFYGLGGDCFNRSVILRVYELKARDPAKPLLVLISDVEWVDRLAKDIPSVFWEIASEFWPGPLTVALKAAGQVPLEICGAGESIAVRLPDVPWLRRLIREAGLPVIATSANISGEREVSLPAEAARIFAGKVDLIVDGGPTRGGAPSTVLDLASSLPRIVRKGAVPDERLQKYLGLRRIR